ncbi:hypothetical protein R3P38DRAFT_697098 [Favolaschia claudopus]|uniref:Secreted protein n=1 Tax=Favolaschia claudopus TaxID=2862362 RepID=A0AAW0EBR1_9AGAR
MTKLWSFRSGGRSRCYIILVFPLTVFGRGNTDTEHMHRYRLLSLSFSCRTSLSIVCWKQPFDKYLAACSGLSACLMGSASSSIENLAR